jgi:hypothetical protein
MRKVMALVVLSCGTACAQATIDDTLLCSKDGKQIKVVESDPGSAPLVVDMNGKIIKVEPLEDGSDVVWAVTYKGREYTESNCH